ncbi:MAG TPA: Hsp20/alpha crystallin family protein [Xanthomarina sp.]|nr:Hsp20/alpha crystallin family protein [Xanthomarina sp.]
MSTLVNVPKNGGLSSTNSNVNLPTWTNWIEDVFNKDLPNVFTSNFDHVISSPKINIKETSESFILEMAIPGIKKSDLNIDLDNDVLSISTEMKEETEHKEDNFTRREFGYSSFKRTFTLPETVDEAKIEAKHEDGVLSILLPKKEGAKKKPARSIEIS